MPSKEGYPVQRPRAQRSEPVDCPICGRPLKLIPDDFLAGFECNDCGQFSDFGGRALPSPLESACPQPQDDEEDES